MGIRRATTVVLAGVGLSVAGLLGGCSSPSSTSPSPTSPSSTSPSSTGPSSGKATAPTGSPVAMAPLYPWGTDHNGTARMYASQVSTAGGITTLTAVRDLTQVPPVSDHKDNGINPPIRYRSGAVHSAAPVTVPARRLRISVEAQLPSVRGTWPAIWLTGVDSWPPEIDVAEMLGNKQLLQNVFATTRRNAAHVPTELADSAAWHTYAAELVPHRGNDVMVRFSVDGRETGSLLAEDLVGKRLWVIANLQTERWSGTPGPDRAVMRFRNLRVG